MKKFVFIQLLFAFISIPVYSQEMLRFVVPSATKDNAITSSYYEHLECTDATTANGLHFGIDIWGSRESLIRSPADGIVKYVINTPYKPNGECNKCGGNSGKGNFCNLGYMVGIEHPNMSANGQSLYSMFLHMDSPTNLNVGDQIKMGQIIGKIGTTGSAYCINHTHFELRTFPFPININNPPYNSNLNRIYGWCSDSNSSWALNDWEDPETITIPNFGNTIYAGDPSNPQNIIVQFKVPYWVSQSLTQNTISNIKIGNQVINTTGISKFSSLNNGWYMFELDLPNNSTNWVNNSYYNLSFSINANNTRPLRAFGSNQVRFSDGNFTGIDNTWYQYYAKKAARYGLIGGSNVPSSAPFGGTDIISYGDAARLVSNAALKFRMLSVNDAGLNGAFSTNLFSTYGSFAYYFQMLNQWSSTTQWIPNGKTVDSGINAEDLSKMICVAFGIEDNTNNSLASIASIAADCQLSTNTTYLKRLQQKPIKRIIANWSGSFAERITTYCESPGGNIPNGNTLISKAKLAKLLSNAYEFKYQVNNSATSNARISAATNYLTIGDKFELTSEPYGSPIPPQTLAPKTLVSGQIKDFSFPDVTVGGLPVHVYWSVDGGTLTPIGSAPLFQSVKFTAPTVSSQTTYHLYYYAATSGGYAQEFFQDIIVNPTGTPPADNGISVQLSSNSLDFGSIAVNTTSDRTLTVTNPSTSTGSLVGSFNMQSGTAFTLLSGPINFNLTPGQSVTYQFRFQPTSGGSFSLPFLLNHNGKNYSTPVSINLTGTATVASGGGGSVSCASAIALTCDNIVNSTTAGGTSQVSNYGTLPYIYNGAEKVYSFVPSASGYHKIEFSGGVLGKMTTFILTNCSNTSTYIADVSGIEWVNLTIGTTYYFVVDGFDNTSGSFSLKVSNCPTPLTTVQNSCIRSSNSLVDYGLELTGSSRSATISITNRTSQYQDLTFSFTGTDASLFTMSGSNAYLNANETKSYDIYWNANPSGNAYQRATLNITTPTCTSPLKVNLQGKVIPTFNFTRPVGGEIFYLGADPDNIVNWTTDYGGTTYDLQYSVDGGISWLNESASGQADGSGSYNIWFTGSNDCTTKGKIRMRVPGTDNWYESQGLFTIRQKRYSELIFVTNPVGNELLKGGQVIRVAWEDYFNFGLNKTVKISYDGGATYQTIASNLTQNYFDWTVPYFTTDKNNCYIMVTDGSHDDTNNCSFRIAATQAPPLNFTYTVTPPTCNVISNGVITLLVTGGTSPYSYEWKKDAIIVGGNSATLSSAGVGNYEFKITDATGNIKTGLVSLSATNFTVSPTATAATCSKNNGSASLSINPTGSYTYNWGSGITTPTLTNQTGGTYTVRVTQQPTGCYQDVSVTIPATLSNVTVSIPQPSTVCFGNTTSITATPTGGTAPYTYVWSSGGNTQTVAFGAGGYQNVATDINGCQGSSNIIVNGYAQTIGGVLSPQSQTICQNVGSVNTLLPEVFTLSGYTGNILRWEYKSPTGGWTNWNSAGSTTSGNCCFGTAIGNWKVRAVVRDAANNCPEAYSAEGDVIVMPTPTAILSGTQTINAGQTATLTVNFTGSAPWSIIMNGQTYSDILTSPYTITVMPATTTTYTLTSMTGECGAGTVSGSAVVTINTVCTVMNSIVSGSWLAPLTWSCNRIPTYQDIVTISVGHIVTIPSGQTGYAKDVKSFGTLSVSPTAKLSLNTAYNLSNGLVLHIPFDGNTNDISGNNNNPISTGTTSSVVDRKNQSLKAGGFGGVGNSGYHKVTTNSSLQFTNGFSISGWYYLPSYYGMNGFGQAATNGYNILLGKEGDRNGFYLGISNNTTTDQQQVNFTNNVSSGNNNFNVTASLAGTAASNLNKWIHVGITVANNEVKIFINGILANSQSGITTNYTSINAGNLYIGTMWAGGVSWYPYGGRLDELRIYNRVLPNAEIQFIYDTEKP